jgi:predicted membrane protein
MYSAVSKTISFFLAMGLSSLILFMPQALTHQDNTVNHSLLMLLLIGIMIGFIHGIGFRAKSLFIGYLISPIFGWPIMIGGLILIAEKTAFL